jgi:flagellar protein FlaG
METSISASSAAATTNYFASQTSTTNSASSTIATIESVPTTIENAVTPIVSTQAPTTQELKVLVNDGNKLLKGVNSNLQFVIDDSTKQVVVKIIDNKTGDVIRQIPTVEMLDFIRHMKELEGNAGAIGAIFKAKV